LSLGGLTFGRFSSYIFAFFSGRTEYQSTLETIIPRRHVHFERRPSHRFAQRTPKTTKVTWATPTTTLVDEETTPISTATLPRQIETKAILKGSTQNVNSTSTTSLSPQPDAATKLHPEQGKKPESEPALPVELNHQHSPVGKRISSGSSGYSATDEVDYLKWISESATRPRQDPVFGEKRTESDSSGCSPDGVESPDTIREEVTPSPQRSSSPDSGYEHGNGMVSYLTLS